MRIVFFRHAIAEDREEFSRSHSSDDLRPLSDIGIKKIKSAASGIKKYLPAPQIIFYSPLLRAKQTAQILGKLFSQARLKELDLLNPARDAQHVANFLHDLGESDAVYFVGHEPHLSEVMTILLTGKRNVFLHLKKAGAAVLQRDSERTPVRYSLVGLLQPSILRGL